MKTFNYIILFAAMLSFLGACRKLIEVPTPVNQLTSDKVFSDSASATSAIGNAYLLFQKSIDPALTRCLGLYSDELSLTSHTAADDEFLNGRLTPGNGIVSNLWTNLYQVVYQCNDIIGREGNSPVLSASFRSQITNEAKFLRGYAYLTLINCFGAVPLVLSTNVNANTGIPQSDSVLVYRQIVNDLNDAKNGLPQTYPGNGRVRANKWAATALLARVMAFQHNWNAVETAASEVINASIYNPLPTPGDAFIAGSQEAILQLWTQFGYTPIAPQFIPSSGAPVYPLADSLQRSFELGDKRKDVWTKSTMVSIGSGSLTFNYAFKYRNRSTNSSSPEYLMILRLGEQYLLRAEARAWQNKIGGAQMDLNEIRTRAGLPQTTASTADSLLAAIYKERRVELFTEWGHHFFDLKRWGMLSTVLGNSRPGWSAASGLLPIPQSEINANSSLKQNPGY